MGKPAVIFALVVASLTIFISYAFAVARTQIRKPGIAVPNAAIVTVSICQKLHLKNDMYVI